jgi:pimeloyl-ACP methyl ester carboxylesterase
LAPLAYYMAAVSRSLLCTAALVSRIMTTPTVVTELTLTCADGVQMAAQHWRCGEDSSNDSSTNTRRRRILCVHGWMDNCRSFHYLAPTLLAQLDPQQQPTDLVALDFVGHGWSTHKSVDGPPIVLAELAFYIAEAVRQLQWSTTTATTTNESTTASTSATPFTLIGHSMGAAIGCIYAAAFPEQVQKLVLLEGGETLGTRNFDSGGNATRWIRFALHLTHNSSLS